MTEEIDDKREAHLSSSSLRSQTKQEENQAKKKK